MLENWPAGHAVQVGAPTVARIEPLAQGVQRSFGSAQKELTSDLHSLEAGGKLTQANANDAVRNWLAATDATAGVKGAPGIVAAEEGTPPSALPWYKRFGPFDTSM